jgi:hypothetical protein
MRADVGEPGLDLGNALALALGLRFGQEPRPLAIGREHDVEQAFGAVGRLLREPADAAARGDLHLALLGHDLAGDDAKERGLAGAVAADQADAGAVGQGGGGIFQERAPADPVGDVVDAEHRGDLALASHDVK